MEGLQGRFLTLAETHSRWGQEDALAIASPAAGAGFTIVCDPRWRTIVRSLRFELTTSAQVANRHASVAHKRNGLTLWSAELEPAVAASKTQVYSLFASGNPSSGTSVGETTVATIPEVLMHPSDELVVSGASLQTEDTFTAITATLERFDFAGIPNWQLTDELRELFNHLREETTSHG